MREIILHQKRSNETDYSTIIVSVQIKISTINTMHKIDDIDRKILAELQANARITNIELSRRVGISAPPCLRRVKVLEQMGLIQKSHVIIDAQALGFDVNVFAMVGLHAQSESDLKNFEEQCHKWPIVRECHMLNGEVDFILKCTAPDLPSFQTFLTSELLSCPNVESVKTSLVIRNSKNEPCVPFELLTNDSATKTQ